jgi:hypothetical protein
MPYEIGTASDYKDLLDRLRLFVSDPLRVIGSAATDIDELDPIDVADAWTVERWDTNYDGAGGYELVLSGPGVSGSDGVLVAITTWANTTEGGYNWCLNGYTAFSSMLEFFTQVGSASSSKSGLPQVLLNNSAMQYWFFANGRRICGAVKVAGAYYASFYLGYYLPYGLPNTFPYPLVIGGSSGYSTASSEQAYSNTSVYNRGYVNGYHPSSVDEAVEAANSLLLYNATWYSFGNFNSHNDSAGSDARNTWPFVVGDRAQTLLTWYVSKNPNDEPPLFPVVLTMRVPSVNVLGELQGVFAVMCDDIVAEDTITVDGKVYVVFQNGLLTASNDFYAICKE